MQMQSLCQEEAPVMEFVRTRIFLRHRWKLLKLTLAVVLATNIYVFIHHSFFDLVEETPLHSKVLPHRVGKEKIVSHPFAHLFPSYSLSSKSRKCVQPKLSIKHDALANVFETLEPLNCTEYVNPGPSNYFYLREGVLFPNKTAIGNAKFNNCEVQAIRRESDNFATSVKILDISAKTEAGLVVEEDFIYILCPSIDGDAETSEEIQKETSDTSPVNKLSEKYTTVGNHVKDDPPRKIMQTAHINITNSDIMSLRKRHGNDQVLDRKVEFADMAVKKETVHVPIVTELPSLDQRHQHNLDLKERDPRNNNKTVDRLHYMKPTDQVYGKDLNLRGILKMNIKNESPVESSILKAADVVPGYPGRPNNKNTQWTGAKMQRRFLSVDDYPDDRLNENVQYNFEDVQQVPEFDSDKAADEDSDHERDSDYHMLNEDQEYPDYYMNNQELEEFRVDMPACWEEQFLVQVSPRREVFERHRKAKLAQHSSGLNVLMFGIDSVSHLTFQRKLPLTLKFLKDELGAVVFDGYNIVGDGTTQAILPIFVGKLQQEIPDILETHLDDLNFIWKHYQKQGYATLFAEDQPNLGVFNLRLKGFVKLPTDHYMRRFWQAVTDSHLKDSCSEQYCTGTTPNHHILLQYLGDFFDKYKNISRFAVGYSGELSHDAINPVSYLDADLHNFFANLLSKGHLKNTVLVVFSDHGLRNGAVRQTLQGKLEERRPFLSIALPKSFKRKHATLFQQMSRNFKSLTTPFDVHETLLQLLDLSKAYSEHKIRKRGISLFQPIPQGRTCAQAGIDTHWCTCMHETPVPVTEPVVKGAADAVVTAINKLTLADRHHCVPLKHNLTRFASLIVPNMKLLTFVRTKETENFEATYGNATNDMAEFQVTVQTDQCGGVFEATVQALYSQQEDESTGQEHGAVTYNVKQMDISRIDTYGTQSACICKTNPHIMKFCCCKTYLKGEKLSSC